MKGSEGGGERTPIRRSAPMPEPVGFPDRPQRQGGHADGELKRCDIEIRAWPVEIDRSVLTFVDEFDEAHPAARAAPGDDREERVNEKIEHSGGIPNASGNPH
jgi:hypothetical protein